MAETFTADLAFVAIFGLILYYLWLKIAPSLASGITAIAAAPAAVFNYEVATPSNPPPDVSVPTPINAGSPIDFYMNTPTSNMAPA